MKQRALYECEYCDFTSADKKQAIAHEAQHFGLTVEEYREWKTLNREATIAGYRVGVHKCSETDEAFTAACMSLADFEEQHNLCQVTKPSHFFA